MVQTPIDEPMKMDGEKPSTSSFVKIKNESKKFKCPACRKSFKTAFELRKHDGKLEHVHYFSCKDFVLAGRPGRMQTRRLIRRRSHTTQIKRMRSPRSNKFIKRN